MIQTIEDEHYASFSVILLDSVVNVDKKYYPQIYLKVKKKKIMQQKRKKNEYN